MSKYICPNCNKDFKQKINFINHTEKKKLPCQLIANYLNTPKTTKLAEILIDSPPKTTKLVEILINSPPKTTKLVENLIDNLIKDPEPNSNSCICTYCEKTFARTDSLQRHLNGRCKSKGNYDELEKLKKDMKLIIDNYQKTEKENVNLKNKIVEIETIQNGGNKNNEFGIINNINNINNNNNNTQINKGVILNNTVNIQVVQFGNEDIDKLNLVDAMKSYLKSTGGNIASTMLNYINLNKDYPENNNICITDLSREIVKIHNGEKFVYKKFKNIKDDILNKIVKNTRKIVNKYETDENFKKSADIKSKLKINDVSLKIIDGISAEDIVRDEIKEQEKLLIKNENDENSIKNKDDSESEEEREFTLEERLRIKHLEKKREGMQKKTFENIKDGLYNAKELVDNTN